MDFISFIGKIVIGQVTEHAVDRALEPVPWWVFAVIAAVVLAVTAWGILTFFSGFIGA